MKRPPSLCVPHSNGLLQIYTLSSLEEHVYCGVML